MKTAPAGYSGRGGFLPLQAPDVLFEMCIRDSARTAAELLIRLYVGPQVLEKALVPEDVHRQGARHQNIRHGAGAYLRYELREAGGVVVVGVELGIVEMCIRDSSLPEPL